MDLRNFVRGWAKLGSVWFKRLPKLSSFSFNLSVFFVQWVVEGELQNQKRAFWLYKCSHYKIHHHRNHNFYLLFLFVVQFKVLCSSFLCGGRVLDLGKSQQATQCPPRPWSRRRWEGGLWGGCQTRPPEELWGRKPAMINKAIKLEYEQELDLEASVRQVLLLIGVDMRWKIGQL